MPSCAAHRGGKRKSRKGGNKHRGGTRKTRGGGLGAFFPTLVAQGQSWGVPLTLLVANRLAKSAAGRGPRRNGTRRRRKSSRR